MSGPLLRATEVAALLNTKLSTVYALCRRGDLPYIRLAQGRRRAMIRFSREDIDRVIQKRRVPDGVER